MAISRISDRKQSLRTFSGVQKGSVYFDGSGDYITTPSAGAFQLEKDFTIECWVYPLSFSGSPSIWCAGTETTNRFITALNTSGQITTNLYSGSTTTYSGIIPANQWTHLAWVRYGSTFRLFINGTASTTTETQTGTFGNGTFRIGADASGATGFLGYISNFRIVKDIAVYFGNFISPTAPLSFDTNSASGFFNGTSNYLDISTTNNTSFDWIAGNTTIETWIFPTSVSGYKSIISKNNISTNNDWDLALDSTGKLNWFYWRGSSQVLTSTTAVTLNTWSHVAFVYNRSSQQINLFINGANTAGAAYIPTRDLNTSSLKIGASYAGMVGSTTAYFSGYMSQFRIVQNNLPVLYSSNFTPSLVPLTSIPGTKLLTLQSSTIKDNSPSALRIETTVPVTGLSATSDGYYSHYFDGTGDYLTVPDTASFAMGSGDFTLEFWLYLTASNGTVVNITGQSDNTGAVSSQSFVIYRNASNQMVGYVVSGSTQYICTSTTTVTAGAWNHIALVRNGNTLTQYVNGVVDGTVSVTGVTINDSASVLGIGCVGAYTTLPVTGYISNFRLVKGTAVYTQTFNPPRLPLQPTQALNDPRLRPEISKSVYFDGTGDYLDIGGTGFAFGSGNFTIELWAYPTVAPSASWNPIITLGSGGGSGGQEIRISQNMNGAGLGYLIPNNSNNSDVYPSFGTLTLNQWHHLALVRNGSTVTLYRNGVSVGSTTGVSFNFTNTTLYRIGGPQAAYTPGDGYFGGFISNLRIVKGQALYTGNTFATSSAPLEISQTPSANIAALYNYPTIPSTGYSTYFDGNGDYITGASPNMGGSWTIEFWMYPTVDATQQTMVSFNAGSNSGINIWRNTSNQLVVDDGVNGQTAGTAIISTNAWSHIAISRSGTTTRAYVNGVLALTNTFTPSTVNTVMIGRYNTNPFYYYTGYISNFRLINGRALYTSEFLPDLTPLTKFGSLNSSTNNNVLGITTIPEKGYSAYFDGTGDYLTTPASSAFRHDQGDWTLECWLYLRDLSTLRVLACMGTEASVFNFALYVTTAGSIRYQAGTGGWAVAAEYGSADGVIALNNWYHVAYVRTGSTLSIYVNGAKVAYQASATFGPGASNKLHIGSYFENATSQNWIGYISNFRFVKDQAVYIGPFTPPSAPLAITQTASSNVAALYSYTSLPSTGRSVYFDGTGDYLDVPHSTNQWIGLNTDFTIECWFYATGGTNSERTLIAKGYQGSPNYAEFGIIINGSNQILGLVSSNGGSWLATPTDTAAITLNTWYHVAMVRRATTITLYKNGIVAATSTGVGDALYNHTGTIRIGQHTNSSNFTGYISNARFVNGTAVYTGEFVPDRVPLTAVANTTLLTCQSATLIDNSTNNFTITASGDAAVSQLTPFANTVTLLTLQGNTFVDSSANAFTMTSAGDTKIFKTFSPFGNTATLLTLQSNTIVDNGEDAVTLTVNGDVSVSNANPFTNTTVLLTAQSNAIVDNSNYRYTLTTAGDAVVGELSPFGTITGELINTIPENGNSIYFDGTGDYLSATPTSALTLTGDFTIEFWVYFTSLDTAERIPVNCWNTGSGWLISTQSNAWNFKSAGSFVLTYSSVAPAAGKWYHVAVTRSGSSTNNVKMFINGLQVAQGTTTSTMTPAFSSGGLIVGGGQSGSGQLITGYVSNFRMVNGTAAYTGNFTVPTAPLAITQTAAANVAAVVNTIPDNGYSAYFDGTGDYIGVGGGNMVFTGDFTIECWVYPDRSSFANYIGILGGSSGNFVPIYAMANGTLEGGIWGSSAIVNSSLAINLNQWNHIALVRFGSSLRFYINGVQDTSYTNSSTLTIVNPTIAYSPSGTWLGYISNMRIINGTALYRGNFTRPTAPLTTYQAPSANVIQAGVPSGGKSIYFDGNGDYVRAGPLQGGLGAGDFTVEGWVKLVSNMRSNDGIFHISTNNYSPSNGNGLGLAQLSNQFHIYFNGISTTPAGTFNIGQWYHFALTRANTSSRLFINGVLTQGPYTDTTNYRTANYVSLGHYYNTGYTMNGHLSNFRIVRGNALYTTTFTPASLPFSPTSNANTVLLIQDSFADSSPSRIDITTFGDAKIVSDSSPFGNVVTLLTLQSPTISDNSSNSIANLFTVYGDTLMVKTESPFGVSNVKILTAQANAIPNSNLVIENASGFKLVKNGGATVSLTDSPFGVANTKLLTLQSLLPIDKSAANNTITLVGDARANVLANVSNPFRVHNIPRSNVSLLTLNGNTIVDTGVTNSGNPWALTVTGDTKTAAQSPFAYAIDTSASIARSYKTKTFTRRAYEKNAKTNRQFMFANGGAFSTTTDGTYIYNVHVFLESNTLTVLSAPGAFKDDNRINFLVVGGGGSGGSLTVDPASPYGKAGGGGGGGFVDAIHYVTSNVQYTMVIGGGASRNGPPTAPGNNGGDSYITAPPADVNFNQITAYGGGAGGGTGDGGGGGSGGGGGGGSTAFAGGGGGSQPSYGSKFGEMAQGGTGGYGNPGGPWNPAVPRANPTGTSGSGGGGAGGSGGDGSNTSGGSGRGYQVGPPATPHPYTQTYAGGGGGAPGGSGGSGGGAPGRNSPNPAPTNGDGGVNLGGGGGGGTGQGPQGPWGSSGGSGIVIAWYKAGIVNK